MTNLKITTRGNETAILGFAVEIELPELTGTEKQIAWAKEIRAAALQGLNKMIDDKATKKNIMFGPCQRNNADDMAYVADAVTKMQNYMDAYGQPITAMTNRLFSRTNARFWIDNRDVPFAMLAIK